MTARVLGVGRERRRGGRAGLRIVPRRLLSLLTSAAIGVATCALLLALARLSGTTWAAIGATLRTVGPRDLAVLALVWAAGLWCHSWVLTASLPGLTRGRALLLNVSGSAVSDLIPFGAAAGSGVNLAMLRSWHFSATRFASFTAVSNLWNVVAKLSLPAVALSVALATGAISSPRLVATAELALALSALLALCSSAALADARIAAWLGRRLDRLYAAITGPLSTRRGPRLAERLPRVRNEVVTVIRRGWVQLSAGMLGYLLLQAALWWLCLDAVGDLPTLTAIVAGFTVERVLSMLPLTPGGAGVAEAGSIAIMVSLGGLPVSIAAGVLLYRGFAFLIEIPVGGMGLLAWFCVERRRRIGALKAVIPVGGVGAA